MFNDIDIVIDNETYVETLASEVNINGAVYSVNGMNGDVIIDSDDISTVDKTNKFVTAQDLVNLSHLSGVNTGDQDLTPYVPYTGATSNIELGQHTIKSTQHVYDTTYVTTGAELHGSQYYNRVDKCIDTVLEDGIVLQNGQEMFINMTNNSGVNILNGQVVALDGAIGATGRLKCKKGIADGSIPNGYNLGVATQNINNGDDGKVTWFGLIRGINTTGSQYGESWEDGDVLYVSPTILGGLTNVKPQAPDLKIIIGVVLKANSNQGSIWVRPRYGNTLVELDDVNGTPTTVSGQILVWDNSRQVFDFTDNINNYVKKINRIYRYSNIQRW